MKKILLISLVLIGCTHQVVPSKLKKAVDKCHSNEGVFILTTLPNSITIYCNNGAKFLITNSSTNE